MSENPSSAVDISVVISTYNRCDLLPKALESLLAQEAEGVSYEVIIVDNNSTDETRAVIEGFIARGHSNLRYIFEDKQGVSHGRNAGIANASGQIISFTDDDVRVAPDWVATIKRVFDEHPEVDYIGGKVLPQWETEPPSWLIPRHWSPLALQDYGDVPFYVNSDRLVCLISANLSCRRSVFERIGGFAVHLQRVKNGIGSLEDHEFMVRFCQSGGQALYEPSIIITADVQAERTTKDYHRRWHTGHGHYYSMMREEAMEASSAKLFDVPAHLYKQAIENTFGWLKHSLSGNQAEAFWHEIRLRFFAGFFRTRRKDFRAAGGRSTVREVASFVRSVRGGKAAPQSAPKQG